MVYRYQNGHVVVAETENRSIQLVFVPHDMKTFMDAIHKQSTDVSVDIIEVKALRVFIRKSDHNVVVLMEGAV